MEPPGLDFGGSGPRFWPILKSSGIDFSAEGWQESVSYQQVRFSWFRPKFMAVFQLACQQHEGAPPCAGVANEVSALYVPNSRSTRHCVATHDHLDVFGNLPFGLFFFSTLYASIFVLGEIILYVSMVHRRMLETNMHHCHALNNLTDWLH